MSVDSLAEQVNTLNVQDNMPTIENNQPVNQQTSTIVGSAKTPMELGFIVLIIIVAILLILDVVFIALYAKGKKENYERIETTTGTLGTSFIKKNGKFEETTTMTRNGKSYKNTVVPFIYKN